MEKPLVSICCITYNHEEYIGDAIEGFLMQEVDFPVEIIIHDDASTDNTQEIIKEYAQKDNRIIPILREENIKSTGAPVFPITFEKAMGKYIAMCEGDDYWTNPLKLQKQVDFMENNEEYSLIVGGFESLNTESGERKKVIRKLKNTNSKQGYSFELIDTAQGWITKTLTALFRKETIQDLDYIKYNWFRDIHFFYHILQNGKGFYLNEILGVYRIHPAGIFSSVKLRKKRLDHYYIYKELYSHDKNEFTKKRYFDSIKDIFEEFGCKGILQSEDLSFKSLVKTSFYLAEELKDWVSLFLAILPLASRESVKKLKITDNFVD